MKQHCTGLQVPRFVAAMLVVWLERSMTSFFERFFFRAPRLQYQNAGNTAPE